MMDTDLPKKLEKYMLVHITIPKMNHCEQVKRESGEIKGAGSAPAEKRII